MMAIEETKKEDSIEDPLAWVAFGKTLHLTKTNRALVLKNREEAHKLLKSGYDISDLSRIQFNGGESSPVYFLGNLQNVFDSFSNQKLREDYFEYLINYMYGQPFFVILHRNYIKYVSGYTYIVDLHPFKYTASELSSSGLCLVFVDYSYLLRLDTRKGEDYCSSVPSVCTTSIHTAENYTSGSANRLHIGINLTEKEIEQFHSDMPVSITAISPYSGTRLEIGKNPRGFLTSYNHVVKSSAFINHPRDTRIKEHKNVR